jgi:hypothetical protein
MIINYKFREMKLLIFLQCMIVGFLMIMIAAPIAVYQAVKA